MAEGSGGGAATFSFDELTEAAGRATQLIRAQLSPPGTRSTWLGPSSVLADAVAGSVLICESSEDGSFVAVIPPKVPSSSPVRRLRGVVSVRVSRDGSLGASRFEELSSLHSIVTSIVPGVLTLGAHKGALADSVRLLESGEPATLSVSAPPSAETGPVFTVKTGQETIIEASSDFMNILHELSVNAVPWGTFTQGEGWGLPMLAVPSVDRPISWASDSDALGVAEVFGLPPVSSNVEALQFLLGCCEPSLPLFSVEELTHRYFRTRLDLRVSREDASLHVSFTRAAAVYAAPPKKPPPRRRRRTVTVRRPAIFVAACDDTEASSTELKAMVTEKSPALRLELRTALRRSPLFEKLADELIDSIIDVMREVVVEPATSIIAQGAAGDNFYLVTQGTFTAHVEGVEKAVEKYGQGDCFGELALLYNAPRAATVKTRHGGVVYALGRHAFRRLVQSHNTAVKVGLEASLKTVPMLSDLDDEQRASLITAMEDMHFEEGEYIIETGQEADALYLIVSGEVVCTRKQGDEQAKELIRLAQGQFFGESAIATSNDAHVRLANVVCVTNVRVAKLMAADFRKLLGSLSDVLATKFKRDVMQSVELFESLDDSEKDRVAAALQDKSCREGETVITQGDKGSTFYVIKGGKVEVSKNGEVVTTLEAGAFFGESSLLTDEPCNSTVKAISPLQLLTLSKKDFEHLLGPLRDILEREKERRAKAKAGAENAVAFAKLKVLGMLGEGSFGHVQLVQHEVTRATYALKCLSKGQLVHDEQIDHVILEKQLLEKCYSPFVLRLVGAYSNTRQIFLLTDLAQGGELFTYLSKKKAVTENVAAIFTAQVSLAFEHLHQKRIAHRDLKPENLLFDKKGYLKLVDFGFAKVIVDRSFTLCGTPEYLAPEIISNRGHNKAVDWWTVGVLTYEMIVGSSPFVCDSQVEMYRRIMKGHFRKLDSPSLKKSTNSQSFVAKLLVTNPSTRLGCLKDGTNGVLQHPFFSEIDWVGLRAQRLPMPFVPKLKSDTDTSCFEQYESELSNVAQWDQFLNDAAQERFDAVFGKNTAPDR
ncbi:hypothetical protein AB1Y20_022765 [Prymnesium parvum]|uniref:cGMP-dependent protein kinase n=1 Tax=Prymnesium parvum TaxID=97485 RepID=A0AB34JII8_PRYPA